MNTSRLKALIGALRADLDALERAIEEEADEGGGPSPWMNVRTYAKWAGVSADTVRTWIAAGMRSGGAAVGSGRLTRIHRDKADDWRRHARW